MHWALYRMLEPRRRGKEEVKGRGSGGRGEEDEKIILARVTLRARQVSCIDVTRVAVSETHWTLTARPF